MKTILAFASILRIIMAQTDVLDVRALASTAQCPVTQGPDVDANVLAVVRFVETATATVKLGGIAELTADLSVNLDLCLCVDANVAIGAINLPVDLEAAAIADIEAFAALQATVDPAANFFNQLVGVEGVEVDVDLVPVQRTTCACPTEATPTCSNGTCSCACPTGFFYDAPINRCLLSASGSRAARRSRMSSELVSRQAKHEKRSQV